ncbi:MAG: heparinase II/III family protein [Clostridia bacterium]|nr:heparinase II/III family protein [Clostridia bacterium]
MNLLGKGMDKSFWNTVRESESFAGYREVLNDAWNKAISRGDIRALRYSEFKMFFVDGNREIYQNSYFQNLEGMTAAALMSLVYPEEEQYLNYLMDAIYAVCDEYTWCLPAHQPSFEENNNCHIDLFAALTGFYLSEIHTLLNDRLEPLILSRIEAELERRIFTPFLAWEPYWWWETCTSNWVAVCMGSVACTFMLMRPEKARELIPRFQKSMAGFLLGFSDEGVCYEGGDYWNYGVGHFLAYADMLRTFTDGKENYFTDPRVKKIATFYNKIFIGDNVIANFADCGANKSLAMGRMHYLKAEYPDEMKNVSFENSKFSMTYSFCEGFRQALWYYDTEKAENANVSSEFYATSAEWYIKRTENYGFAAKGGNNNEYHNHNDVGHFIFAKGNRQILCDLGVGVYTRQYFGHERYGILETSARGHSVPIIDGEYQMNGKEYAARDFKYENGKVTLDIAGAYKNLSASEKIERSFTLSDSGVTLTDKFSFDSERAVVERFVTRIEPNTDTRGTVYVDGTAIKYDANAWSVEVSFEPSGTENRCCYMIDFRPIIKTDVFTAEIG